MPPQSPKVPPKVSPLQLVCPECKNEVDLKPYPNLAPADIIECNFCGITLGVENIAGNEVTAEIVDEGK